MFFTFLCISLKSFQSFDNSNLWPRYHLKNYSCCEEPYPDITYIIRWGTGFIILHYCHPPPPNEQNTKTSAVLRLQYDHAMCSYQWNRWQTAIVVIVIIIIKNGQYRLWRAGIKTVGMKSKNNSKASRGNILMPGITSKLASPLGTLWSILCTFPVSIK